MGGVSGKYPNLNRRKQEIYDFVESVINGFLAPLEKKDRQKIAEMKETARQARSASSGARLGSALRVFALELWDSRRALAKGKLFAMELSPSFSLLLRLDETPVIGADGEPPPRLNLVITDGKGREKIIESIADPENALRRLRAEAKISGNKKNGEPYTAQMVFGMIQTSGLQAEMALPEPIIGRSKAAPAIGYKIPLTFLGRVKDSAKFKVQLQILAAQAKEHFDESPKLAKPAFFLDGLDSLTPEQASIVREKEWPILLTEIPSDFGGVLAELVDPKIGKRPEKNSRKIYWPLRGLGEDGTSVLGWNKVFRGVSSAVHFYWLDASDSLRFEGKYENLSNFYRAHTKNLALENATLLSVMEGSASEADYETYAFDIQLAERIPFDKLVKGARLAINSVSLAA